MAILFNISEKNYSEISKGQEEGRKMQKDGPLSEEDRKELMEELGMLAGRLDIDVEW